MDSDGQELDPAQVYAGAGSTPFANLSLMALPADGDAVHMLAGLLPLPFGVRFRIHGLQPGRVLASVQPGEGLVMDPIRVSKLEGMQAESFEVGARSSSRSSRTSGRAGPWSCARRRGWSSPSRRCGCTTSRPGRPRS